jgi:hypothetical protein
MIHDSIARDDLDAAVILATREIQRSALAARIRVREWDLIVCPPAPLNRGAVKK